jgi:hypothetical protein
MVSTVPTEYRTPSMLDLNIGSIAIVAIFIETFSGDRFGF